jgi:hypothetical protein
MNFALISEGASEHRIIKYMLARFFKGQEPFINPIQPPIANGKQSNSGGWNEVLKYCERNDDIREIFKFNNYLIIQIDTDQSETKPFSVSHSKEDGSVKTPEELYTDVIERLNGLINNEIRNEFGEKIFFAICIHTIECWLLPVYYTNNHKTKIQDCLSWLNNGLRKDGIPRPITKGNKSEANGVRAYEKALSYLKKKKEIIAASKHNFGFNKFITSIQDINEPIN